MTKKVRLRGIEHHCYVCVFVTCSIGDDASYSKSGACFFIMINQGFIAVFTCLTAFMGEKPIVAD